MVIKCITAIMLCQGISSAAFTCGLRSLEDYTSILQSKKLYNLFNKWPENEKTGCNVCWPNTEKRGCNLFDKPIFFFFLRDNHEAEPMQRKMTYEVEATY